MADEKNPGATVMHEDNDLVRNILKTLYKIKDGTQILQHGFENDSYPLWIRTGYQPY